MKMKKIKCYNCNDIFEGYIRLSNNDSSCSKCREKGFKRNFSKEKLIEIQRKIKKSIKNKVKKIKCYNCNDIFEGHIYLPNNITPCLKCKEKGFKRKISKDKKNTCYNCGKIFIVYKHSPNDILPCPECKEKGFGKNYSKEKLKTISLKHKETMLKNHNIDHPSKMENHNGKVKSTSQRKYGVDHYSQTEDWNEKIIKTNQRKRGFDHHSQTKEWKENTKKTNQIRYNSDYYQTSEDYQIQVFKKIKKKLKLLNLEFIDKEYQGPMFNHNWKCLKCNSIFKHSWNMIPTCKICYPRIGNSSFEELEIFEFVRCLNISKEIIINDKQTIKPLELDIYIPDKKLAIEYNGLYRHSEELQELSINEKHPYSSQTYHLYKTEKCLEKGIQLIHIFEDEWIFKNEIVKSRLKQILNINDQTRIHARKCIIKEITPKRKNEFLEKFHIQGPDSSRIKLGAFFGEDLVSVMTFSKGNISKGSKSIEGIWELNRFCSDSDFHIPGIAGKLLSHFKKNFEWSEIFSYADRRWSQGNLYEKLGFELIHITKPNYWYIKNGKRIHRFSLRKRPDEPRDIPERILRLNEGYKTTWDCGSLKFNITKEKNGK